MMSSQNSRTLNIIIQHPRACSMFQIFGHSHPHQKLAPESNTFNGRVEVVVLLVVITFFFFFLIFHYKEENKKI